MIPQDLISINKTLLIDGVVIRLRGQSNAVGSCPKNLFPSKYYPALSYLQIYNPTSQQSEDFEIGVNNRTDQPQAEFCGCEPMLAERIKTYYGLDTYLIKFAVGSTQLYQDAGETDWNVNSTGEYFDQSMTRYDDVIGTVPFSNPLFFDLWIQGYRDAGDLTKSQAYEGNLRALVNASIVDENSIFVITRLSSLNANPETPRTNVQNAQIAVASDRDRTFVTSNDYTMNDNAHYDFNGYDQIAEDVFQIIRNYIK